jgi:hypothetical protein
VEVDDQLDPVVAQHALDDGGRSSRCGKRWSGITATKRRGRKRSRMLQYPESHVNAYTPATSTTGSATQRRNFRRRPVARALLMPTG